jgi:hypothetical protein
MAQFGKGVVSNAVSWFRSPGSSSHMASSIVNVLMLVDVALLEVELVEEVVSTDDVDEVVEDGEEDAEDDVEGIEVVERVEADVGEEVVTVDATDDDVVVEDVVDFERLRTPIAPATTIITTITITTSTVRPIPRFPSSLKRKSSHRGVTRYITMFAFPSIKPDI